MLMKRTLAASTILPPQWGVYDNDTGANRAELQSQALFTGSYLDWLTPHPVRSRWGCAVGGNQGKGPGTFGKAGQDSSAFCLAFSPRLPLHPQLQTRRADKCIFTKKPLDYQTSHVKAQLRLEPVIAMQRVLKGTHFYLTRVFHFCVLHQSLRACRLVFIILYRSKQHLFHLSVTNVRARRTDQHLQIGSGRPRLGCCRVLDGGDLGQVRGRAILDQ